MTDHKNIHEAMLAVYQEVGYVQKKGKNSAQNYRYAGETDFIEAIRPAMINAGIICFPKEYKDGQYIEVRRPGKGGGEERVSYNAVGTYVYCLYHAASSTGIDVEVRGEGNDSLDKASYKAATGAFKYALRQAFMIETGDDPDNEAHDKSKPEESRTATEKNLTIAGIKSHLSEANNRTDLDNRWKAINGTLSKLLSTYDAQTGEQIKADIIKYAAGIKERIRQAEAMVSGHPGMAENMTQDELQDLVATADQKIAQLQMNAGIQY